MKVSESIRPTSGKFYPRRTRLQAICRPGAALSGPCAPREPRILSKAIVLLEHIHFCVCVLQPAGASESLRGVRACAAHLGCVRQLPMPTGRKALETMDIVLHQHLTPLNPLGIEPEHKQNRIPEALRALYSCGLDSLT